MVAARKPLSSCDLATLDRVKLAETSPVAGLQHRRGMTELSDKRKRTLALHDRALRFSADVNACCPKQFSSFPSKVVWEQLVRAADSTSNNLIEADDASSDADFLSKMGIALREAKESRAALIKLRLGNLDNYQRTAARELESEASQLSAIFAKIILNMRTRLADERGRRVERRGPKCR